MNRNYNTTYFVPEKVQKQKTNRNAVRRLQPEYNKWDMSINERLKLTDSAKISIFDDTDYLKKKYVDLYKYLNENMKKNEVLYIDSRSCLPYTVAYVKGNTFEINYKKAFGYSLSSFKRTNEISFNGYVFTKTLNEAAEIRGKTVLRTFNNSALHHHRDFVFKKRFGNMNLYYYKGGESFQFENQEKIMDYKNTNEKPEDNKSK